MAATFLLLVVKPMSYRSSKVALSICECFRIVVLVVSDLVDHHHMPNSVVLTRRYALIVLIFHSIDYL